MAAGGQGAPLVPVFHAVLAEALPKPLAVLNLGGVGNVTWIGPEGAMLAFDTGPANGPLDDWMARHGGAAFDRRGAGPCRAGGCRRAGPAAGASLPGGAAAQIAGPAGFRRAMPGRALDGLSPADGAATLVAFAAAASPPPPACCRSRPANGWSPAEGGTTRHSCRSSRRHSRPCPPRGCRGLGRRRAGSADLRRARGARAARAAAELPGHHRRASAPGRWTGGRALRFRPRPAASRPPCRSRHAAARGRR